MLKNTSNINTSSILIDQMAVSMRLLLALSALVIIYIDPLEPDRYVFETYLALILYSLYSTILFIFIRNRIVIHHIIPNSHWLDVVWYIVLIALSSGTSSLFFFFFFFAILSASFGWGFSTGLKVTLVSSISFTIIGFLTSPGGQEFELNRFLLRPIYLTALGYMIAYLGGYEIQIKRRLALLKEITIVSNPRFGVERTISVVINLLREFYHADECLLIINDEETNEFVIYNSNRTNAKSDIKSNSLNSTQHNKLFSLPKNCAVVYGKKSFGLNLNTKAFYAIDLKESKIIKNKDETFAEIAEKLDTKFYLTVPIFHRRDVVGRIFVMDQKSNSFEQSDIDFLLQAINQFMPTIENIRLVDHLASSAAEVERKKIAHDIHDSIIQPYIGLQIGVDSILQLIDEDKNQETNDSEKNEIIEKRIRRLSNLTEKGISDLRGYIQDLSKPRGFEASFLPAINRFSEQFTNATGIAVEINASDDIQLADRLAAELFQIVVESLSNIRRHTNSPKALINLTTLDDKICLSIENNKDNTENNNFLPRSISERVNSLGGFIEIQQNNNKTVVWVEIPL